MTKKKNVKVKRGNLKEGKTCTLMTNRNPHLNIKLHIHKHKHAHRLIPCTHIHTCEKQEGKVKKMKF